MGAVAEITDANFDSEVLQATEPVLVDFWAPWCGQCRQLSPVIEQLAAENAGSLKVTKMNVDDNQHTPQQYGITGLPTLLVFQDGQVKQKIVGAKPKAAIQQLLDEFVA